MGCGSRIQFWHDLWCGERQLQLEFPLLYSFARQKDVWVADIMEVGSGVVVYNVHFERTVNDWEMDVCSMFYGLLYSKVWRRRGVDKLIWTGSKNGIFSVKSIYPLFRGGSNMDFP